MGLKTGAPLQPHPGGTCHCCCNTHSSCNATAAAIRTQTAICNLPQESPRMDGEGLHIYPKANCSSTPRCLLLGRILQHRLQLHLRIGVQTKTFSRKTNMMDTELVVGLFHLRFNRVCEFEHASAACRGCSFCSFLLAFGQLV